MTQPSRILHIFGDEGICRTTIELYKKLDQFDQNYLIISDIPKKSEQLYPNDSTVMSILFSKGSHKIIASKIKDYDIIILQALSAGKAKAIIENRFKDKVFIWALWGFDLYNIVNYFTASKNAITTTIAERSLKQKLQDFYTYRIIYRKALKKIKICVFLLEHDFDLLTKTLNHNAIWMTACYQTQENLLAETGPFEVNGNDILMGNSSTPSNRHEFIFNRLQECDLKESRIITPLSYGDETYKNVVLKSGESIFGDRFVPILDFMELDEYQKLLSTCGHVIMGHERQQAFGTLLTVLLAGSKLYLSEKSPFFNWFKDMGVILYSVEADLENEINVGFSMEDRATNKAVISNYLSMNKRIDALQSVLERAQQFQLNIKK